MCCTDVSCWYLQVFLGPQSMNKICSCFFVWTLAKKHCKITKNPVYLQTPNAKGLKRTLQISEKSSNFANRKIITI